MARSRRCWRAGCPRARWVGLFTDVRGTFPGRGSSTPPGAARPTGCRTIRPACSEAFSKRRASGSGSRERSIWRVIAGSRSRGGEPRSPETALPLGRRLGTDGSLPHAEVVVPEGSEQLLVLGLDAEQPGHHLLVSAMIRG